jgi:hypothetical protein
MNQQLLEQLASKLNTTTEHLWSVLIKQAPITSAIDCTLLILWLAACICLYRVSRKAKSEEAKLVFGVSAGLCSLFLMVTLCSSLATVLSGFSNPEYWALKEILRAVKN